MDTFFKSTHSGSPSSAISIIHGDDERSSRVSSVRTSTAGVDAEGDIDASMSLDSSTRLLEESEEDSEVEETDARELENAEATRAWFVETLSPLSLCEHPYTREMFAYLSPQFQLMSRNTLARDLGDLMDKAKLQLNNLLYKQTWVATTADSWSVQRRAFLGMTVHWIDRPSLKRMKATLACRELKVSQTHELLGEVIHDIHQEFGIANKVVATTTDNGANYVAAFDAFGEQKERLVVQEEDEEVLTAQLCDVQGQLDAEDNDSNPHLTLPPHRRCCVHTMNLLATTDINEVVGWSRGHTPWRKATAKVQYLWKLQKQSLIAVMSLPEQVEVLTEYRDVMKPVADTLDSLQGEDNAYMGILLPTLLVLKRWLLQDQQRGEFTVLFIFRFGVLFEDQDLLMASALHPSFTPTILARIAPNQLFGADQDGVDQDVEEVLRATIHDWKPKQESLSWALFPKDHREAWVDLFIKYNTPLPSSAAVERVFSTAGDIVRPKRTALANASFDKLKIHLRISIFQTLEMRIYNSVPGCSTSQPEKKAAAQLHIL
uniref:Uncharacterized LOC109529306 n=1 Tax=Hippocampus comes TaxID=109280 RepID=A0A3Q2Y9A2_HIPCM